MFYAVLPLRKIMFPKEGGLDGGLTADILFSFLYQGEQELDEPLVNC